MTTREKAIYLWMMGLGQSQIARRLDVSRQRISQILTQVDVYNLRPGRPRILAPNRRKQVVEILEQRDDWSWIEAEEELSKLSLETKTFQIQEILRELGFAWDRSTGRWYRRLPDGNVPELRKGPRGAVTEEDVEEISTILKKRDSWKWHEADMELQSRGFKPPANQINELLRQAGFYHDASSGKWHLDKPPVEKRAAGPIKAVVVDLQKGGEVRKKAVGRDRELKLGNDKKLIERVQTILNSRNTWTWAEADTALRNNGIRISAARVYDFLYSCNFARDAGRKRWFKDEESQTVTRSQ